MATMSAQGMVEFEESVILTARIMAWFRCAWIPGRISFS